MNNWTCYFKVSILNDSDLQVNLIRPLSPLLYSSHLWPGTR